MPKKKNRGGIVPSSDVPRDCNVTMGYNVVTKQIVVMCNPTADKLIFTVEQARHFAEQILLHAKMAEGSGALVLTAETSRVTH